MTSFLNVSALRRDIENVPPAALDGYVASCKGSQRKEVEDHLNKLFLGKIQEIPDALLGRIFNRHVRQYDLRRIEGVEAALQAVFREAWQTLKADQPVPEKVTLGMMSTILSDLKKEDENLVNFYEKLQQNGCLPSNFPQYIGSVSVKAASLRRYLTITRVSMNHEALNQAFLKAAEKGDVQFLKGVAANMPEPVVQTLGQALVRSASNDQREAVQAIINCPGFNPARDFGGSALKEAALKGNSQLVGQIIAANPPISAEDRDVALEFAAAWGHEKVVEQLIDWGDIGGEAAKKALGIASQRNYGKVVELLLKLDCLKPQKKEKEIGFALLTAGLFLSLDSIKAFLRSDRFKQFSKEDLGMAVISACWGLTDQDATKQANAKAIIQAFRETGRLNEVREYVKGQQKNDPYCSHLYRVADAIEG